MPLAVARERTMYDNLFTREFFNIVKTTVMWFFFSLVYLF